MLAAEKLNCSVFELMNRPDSVYWRDWALHARSAENRAQNYRQSNGKIKTPKPL